MAATSMSKPILPRLHTPAKREASRTWTLVRVTTSTSTEPVAMHPQSTRPHPMPIGFCSRVQYIDARDPSSYATYENHVLADGFEVRLLPDGPVWRNANLGHVWRDVQLAIHARDPSYVIIKAHLENARSMFGLARVSVLNALHTWPVGCLWPEAHETAPSPATPATPAAKPATTTTTPTSATPPFSVPSRAATFAEVADRLDAESYAVARSPAHHGVTPSKHKPTAAQLLIVDEDCAGVGTFPVLYLARSVSTWQLPGGPLLRCVVDERTVDDQVLPEFVVSLSRGVVLKPLELARADDAASALCVAIGINTLAGVAFTHQPGGWLVRVLGKAPAAEPCTRFTFAVDVEPGEVRLCEGTCVVAESRRGSAVLAGDDVVAVGDGLARDAWDDALATTPQLHIEVARTVLGGEPFAGAIAAFKANPLLALDVFGQGVHSRLTCERRFLAELHELAARDQYAMCLQLPAAAIAALYGARREAFALTGEMRATVDKALAKVPKLTAWAMLRHDSLRPADVAADVENWLPFADAIIADHDESSSSSRFMRVLDLAFGPADGGNDDDDDVAAEVARAVEALVCAVDPAQQTSTAEIRRGACVAASAGLKGAAAVARIADEFGGQSRVHVAGVLMARRRFAKRQRRAPDAAQLKALACAEVERMALEARAGRRAKLWMACVAEAGELKGAHALLDGVYVRLKDEEDWLLVSGALRGRLRLFRLEVGRWAAGADRRAVVAVADERAAVWHFPRDGSKLAEVRGASFERFV